MVSHLFIQSSCAAASQRAEQMIMLFIGDTFGMTWMTEMVAQWSKKERGSFPSPIECVIILWVFALMWKEMKLVYELGLLSYLCDLWNLADCFTNTCFIGWIMLRMTAWVVVQREASGGRDPYYPRENWHAYDPYLISEGMVFSHG